MPVLTKKAPKKSKTLTSKPSGASQPIELPEGMWERVARKAFELWQARGYRDGHDLEDWLDAEAMVMEEIHEARE